MGRSSTVLTSGAPASKILRGSAAISPPQSDGACVYLRRWSFRPVGCGHSTDFLWR